MVHTCVPVGGVRGGAASPYPPFRPRRQTPAGCARTRTRHGRNNGIAGAWPSAPPWRGFWGNPVSPGPRPAGGGRRAPHPSGRGPEARVGAGLARPPCGFPRSRADRPPARGPEAGITRRAWARRPEACATLAGGRNPGGCISPGDACRTFYPARGIIWWRAGCAAHRYG